MLTAVLASTPVAAERIGPLNFTGDQITAFYPLGPMPLGQSRSGLLVDRYGSGISRWTARPAGPGVTELTWSDPNRGEEQEYNVEEWRLRENCAGGLGFAWLDAYHNRRPDGGRPRFRVATSRADMRIAEGHWIDITDGGTCGKNGHPMALIEVPREPYTLRVWGDIYTADGHTVGRRFFWQSTMSYIAAVENACWTDEARVRPGLKQEEAWWDSDGGWTIGSGSIGARDEPDGATVVYARWNIVGRGAGQGWRARLQNGEELCLVVEPGGKRGAR